jgi:hypothetical protein
MITISYVSALGVTKSITLRNYDFGNSHSIESRRIFRKTRGGDIKIYRNPNWPKYEKFSYTFSYSRNIIPFLIETFGLEVTWVDHEGITWKGFILTPASEIVEAGVENIGFTLELEGNKV